MSKGRILVTNARLGRLTAWKVDCAACELSVWPCRKKHTAISVANSHAQEAHQGNAVVAIAKL